MLQSALTPLDEELAFLRSNFGGCYGASNESSDSYKEYAGKIIELTMSNVADVIPVGRYCIAGGVFRSVFYDELPKDIDIFLLGSKDDVIARMNMLESDTSTVQKKVKVTYQKNISKHIRIVTVNMNGRPYQVQFLGQWFELAGGKELPLMTADDVLETFDLVSACFGIDLSIIEESRFSGFTKAYEVNHIATHPLLLKTIANKELMINDFGNMIMKRMKAERFYKYITEYGFRIKNNDQIQKFNYVLGRDNDVESDYS